MAYISDRDFMRLGLVALGYEVTEFPKPWRYAVTASLGGATTPVPYFVAVGHGGKLTLSIGCNVRTGTKSERYWLKVCGELYFYTGIKPKVPALWEGTVTA